MRQIRSQYDSAWKEIIDWGLSACMALLFAAIHADIDWSRRYDILNTELRRIASRSKSGPGVVDRLVRVWLKDGAEAWILLHIEIQSQVAPEFPLRMFLYNTGIHADTGREVISLAILADPSPGWRPDHYEYGRWGFRAGVWFPTVKLLDFRERWEELEQSDNPFAAVIMAHLKSLETGQSPQSRMSWKLRILKGLYRQGRSADEIRRLFRFIDAVMVLPESWDQSFFKELTAFEEERRMPFITSVERLGIKRGIEQGIEQGIERGILQDARQSVMDIVEVRFEQAPADVAAALERIQDIDRLRALRRRAIVVASLDEFRSDLG